MESIIFVLLPISLLVLVSLLLAAFFEVAFAGPSGASPASLAHRDLPLLSGAALRQWASDKARQVVAKFSQGRRKGSTAIALAHEIEDLTSRVIESSLPRVSQDHSVRCDRSSRETISLTTPEVLTIVDALRRRLSRRELQEIRNRAEKNAEQLAAQNPLTDCLAPAVCPLLSHNGCCISYESRPVYCRGNCPSCAGHERGLAGGNERPDAAFAAVVGQGITAGFVDGLTAAGWDGQLYELNSALVGALDLPDAPARWVRGEAVLTSCGSLHVAASN